LTVYTLSHLKAISVEKVTKSLRKYPEWDRGVNRRVRLSRESESFAVFGDLGEQVESIGGDLVFQKLPIFDLRPVLTSGYSDG
jgi:hypothetical protein